MKKILFVTPHLSTGGQPQYLLRQIESCLEGNEVFCVEYSDITGGVFVVQRNRISALLGDRLRTLGEDKSALLDVISEVSPDVIHFQEVPESFVQAALLDRVYSDDRVYDIVVTTHSSYTDPASIKYTADRFILVSDWSREKFAEVFGDEMCAVWEYPVEPRTFDRAAAKRDLGLDEGFAHVLHVGLFTPGKNQGEIFEVARRMLGDKVVFHFVGNQAMNFRDYWEPLMRDIPANCVWHNERHDVERFYMACDAFYFPSLFELNPISVKEAVGHGLKVFLRKLDTYGAAYDGKVTYIGDDLDANCEALRAGLRPGRNIPGSFSYRAVYDMFVENARDGDRMVEIGCWLGKSTDYLVEGILKSGKKVWVDVIDTFKGEGVDIYQDFCENLRGYEAFSAIKDYSGQAASLYTNCSIDFLAIDGDQSYEGVLADISDFYYKVRPGGLIGGDATGFRLDGDTVRTAVGDFFGEGGYGRLEKGTGYNWFHRRPKIQVVHLSTLPRQKRAEKSMMNIEPLRRYGLDIKYIKNEPYRGELDLSKYRDQSNIGNVRPSHYGCFLAHVQALTEMDGDHDYTLIMEEDAYIHTGMREFVDAVHRAAFVCEADGEVAYVSFGADTRVDRSGYDENFDRAIHQTLAHCYLVPNRQRGWYLEKVESGFWEATDLWYNHLFHSGERKRLVSRKTYSMQLNGMSVIDGVYKDYVTGRY